jgi:hypothetical protein
MTQRIVQAALEAIVELNTYVETSGFWPRVRALALRAPVFLGLSTRQTGRCAPTPPIAVSLLLQK